jgi:uncharacterized protein
MEVLLGAVIACGIALTGVGAGVITAPVLMIWLGVPPATAVGTALVFGAAVKLPAALAYWRQRHVDLPAVKAMVLGGLPGVLLGALLLELFAREGLKKVVLLLVGLVVVTSAILGLVRTFSKRSSTSSPSERRDHTRRLRWVCFPIGIEVGFSSAGAGALGTLALLHFTPLTAATVVGTDLLFGLALSLAGGGMHVAFGSWDPLLLAKLVGGGLVGVALGTRMASWMPNQVLRVGLLLWLTYLGSHMTYQAIDEFLPLGQPDAAEQSRN